MFGLLFVFGVQVVSPVLMVMLIAETALGLISRAAPSLNLMAIGFPVRLLAGLIALSAAIAVLPSAAARLVTPAMELASRLAVAFK
jgi:flagellar biosynthesis protein FliR